MTTLSPELTVLGIIYTFFGGFVGAIFVAVLFQEKSVLRHRAARLFPGLYSDDNFSDFIQTEAAYGGAPWDGRTRGFIFPTVRI